MIKPLLGVFADTRDAMSQLEKGADLIVSSDKMKIGTVKSGRFEPSEMIKLANGGWVMNWLENTNGTTQVVQQIIDSNGNWVGASTKVNSNALTSKLDLQTTALGNGGWIVSWTSYYQNGDDGSDVYQQIYNADGSRLGGETRVNSYRSNFQYDQTLTQLENGGWVVSWTSDGQDGSETGIFQQTYRIDGTRLGSEMRVNKIAIDTQKHADVTALADGGWITTWLSQQDRTDDYGDDTFVYQQRFNADGTRQGSEILVGDARQAFDVQTIQLKDGGWVIVWDATLLTSETSIDIFQRVYNANGTPRTDQVVVNTSIPKYQYGEQAVALADGGWVVVWKSSLENSSPIHQQAYHADGTRNGAEFRVYQGSEGGQNSPQVIALANGGWVVAWRSEATSEGYLRVFNENGQPLGDATHFSDTDAALSAVPPRLIALSDGGWAISWLESSYEGGGVGTLYQRIYSGPTPPIASDDSIEGLEGFPLVLDVLSNDRDEDGDSVVLLEAKRLSGPGSVFIDKLGRLIYKPGAADADIDAGEARSVKIEYTIKDQREGGTDTAVVTLTVKGVIEASPDIRGDDTVNSLIGTRAGERLIGFAGHDVLDGKGGADTMIGGTGDDAYSVERKEDVVFELAGEGKDTVTATTSVILTAGQEIETLQLAASTDTRNLTLTGNEFANRLIGNKGNNVLNGKAGADTLEGGTGDDTYGVDQARDKVLEAANAGHDVIVSTVSYLLADNQSVEILQFAASTGTASLKLTGNNLANTLYGNNGSNVLDGKGGSDVLTGKAGADTFAFTTATGPGNVDRITDFAVADDAIRLLKGVFAAVHSGALAATAFKDIGIAGAVLDRNDRIVYNRNDGTLAYDPDGIGAAVGVQIATLDNKALLTHLDFFVV